MRFLVYGAGAIGGVVGARLFQAGHDVTLVARGRHAAALAASGLRLESPEGVVTLPLPVVETLSDSDTSTETVVLLTVKAQDTTYALDELARVSHTGPLVCMQNGVENERLALRRFEAVYGVCVMLPAAHLEPGIVTAHSGPKTGILDVGRCPGGSDDRATEIAAALASATFLSVARSDIMRWKYRKLVMNLGNAVQALCGRAEAPDAARDQVLGAVEREAMECFVAAQIDVASVEEDRERRADHIQIRRVEGRPRSGGSTYQSLERATGTIETDYLNGEICLLGRLYGVSTPANATLQLLANRSAREHRPPGWLTPTALLSRIP